MRRILMIALLMALVLFGGAAQTPALAQEPQEQGDPPEGLTVFTNYPAQASEIGEIVTFPLTLRITGTSPQVVRLEMGEVPEGWTATFRGSGRIIQAVYVDTGAESTK